MDRGLSCSDKDGFLWFGSIKFGDTFGGDLEELHKMVTLLTLCCLCGELKIMGLFVSERCPVKWTSRAVDKAVAIAERQRERGSSFKSILSSIDVFQDIFVNLI